MRFNKIWNIVFYLVALVAVIILVLKPSRKKTCNEYIEKIKKELFEGQIIDKYIDKEQHYSKVLKIRNNTDTNIWVLTYDKSGLYDFLQLNDSIFKASGSYRVEVYRKNKKDTTYTLDYGCND